MPYTVPDWPVLAAFTFLAIALLAALAGQRRLALGMVLPASAMALWAGVLGVQACPANLLLVSLPEEALFRQGVFAAAARWPLWQRCVLSAALFGLVHVPGGVLWALVATLAGAAYALLYAATGRLAYAVLLHTAFNVLHLAWLSYPQLR